MTKRKINKLILPASWLKHGLSIWPFNRKKDLSQLGGNKLPFWYRIQRRLINSTWKYSKKTSPEKTITSPSGKYSAKFSTWTSKPGCWDYSMAEIYNGEKKIFTVRRNFSSFFYQFVEDHPNGHDYFLCGEDYQGLTVIELDTGRRVNYIDNWAKRGFGFCHASFLPSPDKTKLACEGCFWSAPYQIRFYDFSTPMKLPWKELIEAEMSNELDDFQGEWTDKGLTFVRKDMIRLSDKQKLDDIEDPNEIKRLRTNKEETGYLVTTYVIYPDMRKEVLSVEIKNLMEVED